VNDQLKTLFCKGDAQALLGEWRIESVPLAVSDNWRFMFVPVHGDLRGTRLKRTGFRSSS
jgi:hypothetical protein